MCSYLLQIIVKYVIAHHVKYHNLRTKVYNIDVIVKKGFKRCQIKFRVTFTFALENYTYLSTRICSFYVYILLF